MTETIKTGSERASSAETVIGFAVLGCLVAGGVGILKALSMDHLGIARAPVVGYSLGGMIVMKLATMHPQRVSSVVLGGMGWLKTESPLDRFWENIHARDNGKVPIACLHCIAQLGVTEAQVKAVAVPVVIVVGDRDPCRRMYVEPLRRIRPDWPEHVIADAGHLNCILKPDFKEQLLSALH
jgi:pimeloyl-ACP methyl ester carboxylesterase